MCKVKRGHQSPQQNGINLNVNLNNPRQLFMMLQMLMQVMSGGALGRMGACGGQQGRGCPCQNPCSAHNPGFGQGPGVHHGGPPFGQGYGGQFQGGAGLSFGFRLGMGAFLGA